MSTVEYWFFGAVAIFFCIKWIAKKKEFNNKLKEEQEKIRRLENEKLMAMQHHTTASKTWELQLNHLDKVRAQREMEHAHEKSLLQARIEAAQEKMNLAIGNYQAERRRNFLDEKAYIKQAFEQLEDFEKGLKKVEQAFNQPSKGDKV